MQQKAWEENFLFKSTFNTHKPEEGYKWLNHDFIDLFFHVSIEKQNYSNISWRKTKKRDLKISQERDFPEFMVCRIIERLEFRKTQSRVGRNAQRVLSRLSNTFQEIWIVRIRLAKCRPLCITTTDDWYLIISRRKKKTQDATQL